jgi:hypothetical protein
MNTEKNLFIRILIPVIAAALIGGILYLWNTSKNSLPPPPADLENVGPPLPIGVSELLAPQAAPIEPQDFCSEFQNVQYEVSCKTAVSRVLAEAPGEILGISIGPIRTAIVSNGRIERKTVEMWLVDVKLEKPYFDQQFGKPTNVLRVGIRVDGGKEIYRKALDM